MLPTLLPEWQTGRRFTGMAFATIGFALKSGLALGSSGFLWIMVAFFHYDAGSPDGPRALAGFRICSGVVVSLLFLVCVPCFYVSTSSISAPPSRWRTR